MITIAPRFRLSLAFLLVAALIPQPAGGQTKPKYRKRMPSDLASKAAEYMRARARVTGFSGAVLIARGGRPVFRHSYGFANHEFNIPNTPDTKFRLGSVSKQFTSASILLLDQRGELKLTDPVSRYLTDWPRTWDEVTIHHLLSHTAGLPRITTQGLLDVSALSHFLVCDGWAMWGSPYAGGLLLDAKRRARLARAHNIVMQRVRNTAAPRDGVERAPLVPGVSWLAAARK